MGKKDYIIDNSFKTDIRNSFEAALDKWDKESKNMTPEEIAESIAQSERKVAQLEESIRAEDPEGVFDRMMESMHDPANPLYKTYSHPGEVDKPEIPEYEPPLEDEMIIDEYKQHVFLEGMSSEEALKLLDVEKVTDYAVIWGDESESERKVVEDIIKRYGDTLTDPYTQEEKDERAAEIKQMEADGTDWKGGFSVEDDPDSERMLLISHLVDYIDIDELPVELEDEFLAEYNALSEKEKTIVNMRMEDKPLREVGEAVGMSHEAVRKAEQKIISALLGKC